jgi:hypothetical protein
MSKDIHPYPVALKKAVLTKVGRLQLSSTSCQREGIGRLRTVTGAVSNVLEHERRQQCGKSKESSGRLWQFVSLKRQSTSTGLHGVTPQKTAREKKKAISVTGHEGP